MSLATGSKLGPYEILGAIGAGGMGEVYRAKDPRLGREVAIKVLPSSFSSDADRLRRFEQEAKAAGVLNHPNITAVYDIGSVDGGPYVVQELLEGETLRSVLAGGKLAQRRCIDYALQIAHGLAAAHEKGIVHRDLKPENLFVTRDGRVKILDFGLAKLTHQEEGSQVTNLPTATAGTEPGVVLGTLGYMSPEQVRGKPADPRSDIFAFGAILYEMLSGQRAFHGDSAADTMSAILKEDPPDLSVTNQNVSPGLERIVRHCLEKNPEQRFHSAHDLAFDLEALSTASGAPSAIGGVEAARGPIVRAPIAAAVATLALGIALGHFLWKPAKLSTPTYRRLTFRRGNIATARFAPDGRTVVYSASFEGQPLEVFTTRPEGPESTPLGVKNANLLSASPSGELAISLRERFLGGPLGVGTLATMPLGGGAPRSIAEFVDFADWTPDGKQLAAARFLEGRTRMELPLGKVIYSSEQGFGAMRVSPKGDRIAIFQDGPEGRSILTVDLAGKSKILAGPGIGGLGIAWSPSGDEIWYDHRGAHGQSLLEAVDLSGHRRSIMSAPVGVILHDIARDGRVLVERASTRRGVPGFVPGDLHERDLSWFDGSRPVALSDDGRLLLFNEVGDATTEGAHYLRETDGSPAVNLGSGEALDLSPDGKWVLARQSESPKTLVLQPSGTGPSIPIDLGSFESVNHAVFFPDGKHLLLDAKEPGNKRRLYVLDLPGGKTRAISSRPFSFGGRPVSSDGSIVVGYGDWQEDIFLVPTTGGDPRTVPGTKDVDMIRWTPDGKSLLAIETGSIPARVVQIEVATGRREPWKTLAPQEIAGLINISKVLMTPDGKRYVYGYTAAAISDLYLVEGLK